MIKTTIPSYKNLFEAVSSNHLSSSVRPQRRQRIEEFLDRVVSMVRNYLHPNQVEIRCPFDYEKNQDIKDEVTEILNNLGYQFSVEKYDASVGWCWKVKLYVPE